MTNTADGLDEALDALRARLPEAQAVAGSFAALIRAGEAITEADVSWPPAMDFNPEAFNSGTPLLSDAVSDDFASLFGKSAQVMLPAIQKAFPSVAGLAGSLKSALENDSTTAMNLVRAFFSGDEALFQNIADQMAVSVPALGFLVREILKPCLRRASARLGRLVENELWHKSHCPVCGSRPDAGYLKEKDQQSEYLISKTGTLWLHCSMCGHEWRFVRLVCPSCGQGDHERLEVLSSRERPEERIHACKECGQYLLVADLTKWQGPFNADIAPIGLVYLDILAQEKGYSPMVQTPWNTFG